MRIETVEREILLERICNVISSHETFQICGHIRPDGDCLGSSLGLYYALCQMRKIAEVCVQGPILDHYLFTPGIEIIKSRPDPSFRPEVTIFVDCSDTDRVFDDFEPEGLVVNIDHHLTNSQFGDINYIDPYACAVGEQIFYLVKYLGLTITPNIANNLYFAILADTGGFKYSNTNRRTFEIAAELCLNGANPSWVAQEFYANRSLESAQLAAEVIHNMHFEYDGKFVWSEITQEMYTRYGGEINEPESLVGDMRQIRGVEISLLMHELSEGGIRAGFRSKEKIDVSAIANDVGGGGHHSASGCYLRGDYNEIKNLILESTRKHLEKAFKSTR